jgi:hypothetical protein
MTVISDVSPVDLLAELLDQIGNSLQARMDSERAAEHVERVFVVAEFLKMMPRPESAPKCRGSRASTS